MFDDADEGCKIAQKLNDIHDWAHAVMRALTKEELHKAHALGHQLLELLNEQNVHNGIKFIAVFEVLSVGADVMEQDVSFMKNPDSATIN